MRQTLKSFTVLFCTLLSLQASAQVFENTYTWFNSDHSAWKVVPVNPFGYALAGNKFFEPNNTDLYITSFDEFGGQLWTRSHASGLTLQTFWKSFLKSPDSYGYVLVAAGNQGGSTKAYHLVTNSNGMKISDWVSPLPNGTQFGGLTVATNGGTIAAGGSGSGNLVVVKFAAGGAVQWTKELPVSGFGWTIAQAVGGGYVLAGTTQVARVDNDGNLDWSTKINLPISPDGSAYTYTEFEEITPLPDGSGFIVTGSCFSNSHSGIYTARVNYSGSVAWAKVQDAVNTSLAGTPVCWVNNAIIDAWGSEILTSWRRGPVSTGGALNYQRMNFAGNNLGTIKGLGNNIPVQEAFMTKAHGKYVVGGTRGSYTAAYSYVNASLPGVAAENGDRTEPLEASPFDQLPQYVSNNRPGFELPRTSRVFMSEMRVFPNPSSGEINVGGAIEPGSLLRVMSPLGSLVMEQRVQPDETVVQFNLPNLSPGLYTVEMIGHAGMTSRKILIQ